MADSLLIRFNEIRLYKAFPVAFKFEKIKVWKKQLTFSGEISELTSTLKTYQ